MAHVLQHSFQGAVYLYAEKVKEHIAVVTVGSLISSTYVDRCKCLVYVVQVGKGVGWAQASHLGRYQTH